MVDSKTSLTILFIAGFGPIARDSAVSQALYQQTLGLPLKGMPGNESYLSLEAESLEGIKHFGSGR